MGFCRGFEPGYVFDASRIFGANEGFDLRRISKIIHSDGDIVAALAPLVVHEDNHQLIVFKPPGWLSQSDDTGDLSVTDIFAEYLRKKYHKPGKAFCAAVQRLDRPASGLMALVRTSKAAARISEQLRLRTFEKNYLALTDKPLKGKSGVARQIVLMANMEKIDRKAVARKPVADSEDLAAQYVLTARLLGESKGLFKYDVSIESGKFHQIRALMAAHGAPLIGDVKYGGKKLSSRKNALGLIAIRLCFKHPTTGAMQIFAVDTASLNNLERYFI